MYLIDMEKLADKAHDDKNFCIGCLRSRTDVPVTDNLCYECGGGNMEVLQ